LLLERRNAERLRHAALVVARQDAIGNEGSARVEHELVAHVIEPHLAERGSAEARARRRPQGERGNHLEPRGHFSIHRAAEVAVVLESAADVEQETFAHLALEPSVQAQAVARTVHLVRWLKPGEHLRAGTFRPARGGRVEVDSGATPAVAELPGGLFARLDVVLLAAELGSGDEGERAQRR